jgi:hypothetical protein
MKPWLTRRSDRPLSCRQVGKLLQRYLDDAVDELTARRIAHHLEDCRRCGLEADTYLAIKASLARRDETLPPDAVRRLQDFGAQLAAGQPPPREHDSGWPHQPDGSTGA